MAEANRDSDSPAERWRFGAWAAFAVLGGLAAVVVPPLTAAAIPNKAYGHPLIPFFALAFANIDMSGTMFWMAVIGAVLGLFQPRRWPLSCALTTSLPLLLNAVNIVVDWSYDATSHNLFPFEIAIIILLSMPALVAGLGGCLLRRALRRLTAARFA